MMDVAFALVVWPVGLLAVQPVKSLAVLPMELAFVEEVVLEVVEAIETAKQLEEVCILLLLHIFLWFP